MRNKLPFIAIAIMLFATFQLNAQTVLLNEDFNTGSLPTGWTRTQATGSDGFEFGSPAALSSAAFTIPAHTGNITAANDDDCNCNASVDYLITPPVSIGASSSAILEFDAYYGNLTYQGATEEVTIEVSTDGGSSWTSVYTLPGDITQWVSYTVDLSTYSGQTINVGFHYDDGSGWTYGFGLDNVVIFEPAALDAGLSTVDLPSAGLKDVGIAVDGTLTNFGSTAITSLDLHWSDGTTTHTENLTGLNIATLGTYNFSHMDSIDISTPGIYNIQVWTGDVNGMSDLNNNNDTLTYVLEIVDTLVQRNPLHEVFTSSSCGPCAPGNANLATIFNPQPHKQVVLKYQMSWPGSGDPYYTLEGLDRRTYYGVNAVPNMFVDGGWDDNTNSYTSGLRDAFYDVPAFMDISSEIRVECKTVFVDITVTPYKDFPGSNVLHAAVVEKKTFNNVSTNGETEFDNVMKKMMPNASGTVLGPLTKGQPQTVTLDYTFQGNYILPPNANSPVNHNTQHTIEEFFDLDVVAFVQDVNSQEVFQSTYSTDMIGYDIALTELDPISGPVAGTPIQIGGMLENWKDMSTSSLTINYNVDGGPVESETLTGLTMAAKGDQESFTFSNDWTPASGGNKTLKVWIDNFNGGVSTDGSPCNDTITTVVNVTSTTAPTAGFTFSATDLDVDFTDTSLDAVSWAWNFDDGNGSSDQNPSHTYASAGTYNVCLVVTNQFGSDTACQDVSVTAGVGLENNTLNEYISVSPNPNSGEFAINSQIGLNGVLKVYNLIGKEVYSQELSNFSNGMINLPQVEKGVYILNINTSRGEYKDRLVIE